MGVEDILSGPFWSLLGNDHMADVGVFGVY